MSAGTFVPLEEYMGTSYSPDREYVDGVLVERLVGEIAHGVVRSNVILALRRRYPRLRIWAGVGFGP